jgi:hypothetical protein
LSSRSNVQRRSKRRPLMTFTGRRLEWIVLGVIVFASLLVRTYRLGSLPDTVLGDEADNFQASVRILYGLTPENGFFGVDWTQQPAFSAYKGALFLSLFGLNVTALRLSSALLTTLALVPFYWLLRRQLSIQASALATVLLSTNVWYLNFSRSGWNCPDVVLYMLMAMLCVMLGVDSLRKQDSWPARSLAYFGVSGFWCTLGLYGYPAGRAITLGMAGFAAVALFWYGRARREVLLGFIVLFAVDFVAFAPEAAYALQNLDRFNNRTNVVLIFNDPAYKADPVGTMAAQFSKNIRGPWDGRVNNTPRYSPPGEPQLDPVTGAFALAGMVLSLVMLRFRSKPETWLWWLMLLSGWALTQLLTARTPDGARGIGYMPTLLYFAALGLDAVLAALRSRSRAYRWRKTTLRQINAGIVALGLLVAITNLAHYWEWQRSPSTRSMRYIYLTTAEFPRWASDIRARAIAGGNVTNLNAWRALYPIANPADPYGVSQ